MNSSDVSPIDILGVIRPLSAFTVAMTDIVDHVFGTHDAGDAEDLAILALIRSASISVTDLRRQSGLSRRGQAQFLQQLTDYGLVDQTRAPDDRRVKLVGLTRRGRSRSAELERRLTEYYSSSGETALETVSFLDEQPTADNTPRNLANALDVLERMATLGHTLDAAIRAQRAPKHPKNREQLALLHIATENQLRPSRLAEELTLTPGGMTRVLDKLESDRLIVRHRDHVPGDRRAVILELAPDGQKVVNAIASGLRSVQPELRSIFGSISSLVDAHEG